MCGEVGKQLPPWEGGAHGAPKAEPPWISEAREGFLTEQCLARRENWGEGHNLLLFVRSFYAHIFLILKMFKAKILF